MQHRKSIVTITLVLLLFAATPARAQEPRFISSTYNVAFQPPTGAVAAPDPKNIATYKGKESLYGAGAMFSLSSPDTDTSSFNMMSSLITTDTGIKVFANMLVESLKSLDSATLLESRRVKVAGHDAMLVTVATREGSITVKGRMVAVPIPEHNRLYLFLYLSTPGNFEKWAAASDAAIDTFSLLKPDMPSAATAAKKAVEAKKAEDTVPEASPTEIAFWETIKNSDNADDFQAYLNKYPKGAFAELAKIRLEARKKKTP